MFGTFEISAPLARTSAKRMSAVTEDGLISFFI